MWACYMFATFFGEVLAGSPIFPRTFNWQCTEGNCWSELVGPMLLMLALQLLFFVIFYFAHLYRNKWLPLTPKQATVSDNTTALSTQ